jgi:single-strand DNA-binding protein
MSGYQFVTVLGHLGHDPSLNHTKSGIPVCKFSVAASEKRGSGDTATEHTEWFNAVLFERQAENAKKYLKKGDQVLCVGRLETRSYEDKNGLPKKATDFKVSSITYVKTKRAEEGPPVVVDEGFPPEPPDELPF